MLFINKKVQQIKLLHLFIFQLIILSKILHQDFSITAFAQLSNAFFSDLPYALSCET